MSLALHTVTRVLDIPDIHGADRDPTAIKVARDFQKDFKPHITIMLGDLINADCVSKYPTDSKVTLKQEYEIGNELLDLFKPNVFCEGNHEERLRRPGLVAPELREVVSPREGLNIDKRKIIWVPYENNPRKGTYQTGKLRHMHGFWTNIYAARAHAEAYGCVVFGHTHRVQMFQSKMTFDGHVGYNIGCLSRLDLPYQKSKPPRGWMNAFGFGYVYRNGWFTYYVVQLVGQHFVINGKMYSRR